MTSVRSFHYHASFIRYFRASLITNRTIRAIFLISLSTDQDQQIGKIYPSFTYNRLITLIVSVILITCEIGFYSVIYDRESSSNYIVTSRAYQHQTR